uniref:Uncharacterized protein n=1 Tax=Caenorhabditis japonica TaxID=281687 RepID=A0A8R1E1Z3_CAEJA
MIFSEYEEVIENHLLGWQICAFEVEGPFEWQVKAASTFEISGEGGRHRWRPRRRRPLPSRRAAAAAAAFERNGDGGRCRWRKRRRRPSPSRQVKCRDCKKMSWVKYKSKHTD